MYHPARLVDGSTVTVTWLIVVKSDRSVTLPRESVVPVAMSG